MELFGFIGTGNMGGALAEAVCRRLSPDEVMLSNRTRAKAEALAAKTGGRVATNEEIASSCRYIFLGDEAAGHARTVCGNFSCIEGARGNGRPFYSRIHGGGAVRGRNCRTIRGGGTRRPHHAEYSRFRRCGHGALCDQFLRDERGDGNARFRAGARGKTHEISEAEMDAASIISGCAPAYVFMFIKALADAGTSLGLDEKSSLLYAEQTVFGSAKLAMESGKAPTS